MINMPHIGVEYIVVLMAAIILYLIYYVISKDAQHQKHIHSVATVVEELNRDIYYLKKTIKESEQKAVKHTQRMSDDEIYQEIERTVYDMVKPLSLGLKRIEEKVEMIDTQVDSRIANLENGVKQISIPASIHGNDDEKVISLYKQGVGLDTIAKELHISKAEVEFVLKINKIR